MATKLDALMIAKPIWEQPLEQKPVDPWQGDDVRPEQRAFLLNLASSISKGDYPNFSASLSNNRWLLHSLPKRCIAEIQYRVIRNWGHPLAVNDLLLTRIVTWDVMLGVHDIALERWREVREETREFNSPHFNRHPEYAVLKVANRILRDGGNYIADGVKQQEYASELFRAADLKRKSCSSRLLTEGNLSVWDPILWHMVRYAARSGNALFLRTFFTSFYYDQQAVPTPPAVQVPPDFLQKCLDASFGQVMIRNSSREHETLIRWEHLAVIQVIFSDGFSRNSPYSFTLMDIVFAALQKAACLNFPDSVALVLSHASRLAKTLSDPTGYINVLFSQTLKVAVDNQHAEVVFRLLSMHVYPRKELEKLSRSIPEDHSEIKKHLMSAVSQFDNFTPGELVECLLNAIVNSGKVDQAKGVIRAKNFPDILLEDLERVLLVLVSSQAELPVNEFFCILQKMLVHPNFKQADQTFIRTLLLKAVKEGTDDYYLVVLINDPVIKGQMTTTLLAELFYEMLFSKKVKVFLRVRELNYAESFISEALHGTFAIASTRLYKNDHFCCQSHRANLEERCRQDIRAYLLVVMNRMRELTNRMRELTLHERCEALLDAVTHCQIDILHQLCLSFKMDELSSDFLEKLFLAAIQVDMSVFQLLQQFNYHRGLNRTSFTNVVMDAIEAFRGDIVKGLCHSRLPLDAEFKGLALTTAAIHGCSDSMQYLLTLPMEDVSTTDIEKAFFGACKSSCSLFFMMQFLLHRLSLVVLTDVLIAAITRRSKAITKAIFNQKIHRADGSNVYYCWAIGETERVRIVECANLANDEEINQILIAYNLLK